MEFTVVRPAGDQAKLGSLVPTPIAPILGGYVFVVLIASRVVDPVWLRNFFASSTGAHLSIAQRFMGGFSQQVLADASSEAQRTIFAYALVFPIALGLTIYHLVLLGRPKRMRFATQASGFSKAFLFILFIGLTLTLAYPPGLLDARMLKPIGRWLGWFSIIPNIAIYLPVLALVRLYLQASGRIRSR